MFYRLLEWPNLLAFASSVFELFYAPSWIRISMLVKSWTLQLLQRYDEVGLKAAFSMVFIPLFVAAIRL